jgi:5-(carboxyamino)imidazole ribonucleotide mutase
VSRPWTPGPTGEDRAALVGIVMGSTSDRPTMAAAAAVLEDFGVPYELRVMSAHRRPFDMLEYGRQARDRGLRVIVAGAGGAAHLPGMLAAVTTLPVIGVPVPLGHLDGMDSLLSIVQMPRGVPVATVAIGNAHNAAVLALRILAVSDADLAARLADRQAAVTEEVRRADRALQEDRLRQAEGARQEESGARRPSSEQPADPV